MKNLFYLFIAVIIMTGCSNSSLRYLQKGMYDQSIDKSVKKLLKDPKNNEEAEVLNQAYSSANKLNNATIEQLRLSGQPDIWKRIYSIYNIMQVRQEKVSRLSQFVLEKIGYQYINYNNEIVEAKKKAAEYFYVHAKVLLSKNDKLEARKAYDELNNIKSIFPNYKDVDELINKAFKIGCTYVLFKIENNSNIILPPSFEKELTKTGVSELNYKWTIFHTNQMENFYYDYFIYANIKSIDISPERVNQNSYTDSKQVKDGWQYKLDNQGNVMKDSLGNDIKIPKFKTISCTIREFTQFKRCIIYGNLDFVNESNQLIKTDPITAEWTFTNSYITTIGDIDAMSPASRDKIYNIYMPFPYNADMIMNVGNVLKNMVKDIVKRNAHLLK